VAERRPSPEALLERAREEAARGGRGRLKIFFGAAPGVGKTYAMLEDARARQRAGTEVVVGVVETHGRRETEALLEGLEVLPRKAVDHRGIIIPEFDLDAALTRHPELILVDEMAHTNAPESRHTKRWQDVDELLAAGINVYSTLNVQHLESLNDVVAQITGVQVRETVPDAILDRADELELADLSPEDLLARLQTGKVYIPDQAARALDRFFRKGNLIALRELALRRVAERVDAQMRRYMREEGIREVWPAAERLLVCIGTNPESDRVIRAGWRLAQRLQADWIVVHVETPREAALPDADRRAVRENLELAEELGARATVLSGRAPAEELLAFARENNVSRIILGKPTHGRWRDQLFGSLMEQVVRASGDHDVYVITGETEEPRRRPRLARRTGSPLSEYLWGAGIVGGCTALLLAGSRWLTLTDDAMVFILGTVLVGARCGLAPTLLASVLSVALFDFLFIPPHLTFAVSDIRYLGTFVVMLVVGLVTSGLTVRIREQTMASRERERRTATLYALTQDLAAHAETAALAAATIRHVQDTTGAEAALLVADPDGRLVVPPTAPAFIKSGREQAVAEWVYRNRQSAGAGTDTLPGSAGYYVPLTGPGGVLGVLALRFADAGRLDDPQIRRLLETIARQAALALERAALAEQSRHAAVEVEAERLRTALLSSLSHDLRTPLAGITGSASSLVADQGRLSADTRRDLAQTVLQEAERMNRLITNLLSMIRLESGVLAVQKEWQTLEEAAGVALLRLDERLTGHPVTVNIPPDLPLVPYDSVLLEQVFINLLENAIRHTPAGTPIEIEAEQDQGGVLVTVADHGPGVPPGEEERIFDKFYQSGATPSGGVGLGLTICRGIVKAHGGRIWAENRPGGGLAVHFTLPITGAPPLPPPPEPEPSHAVQA
jgi:two-component system sensor histidine kinase KdpD